MSLRDDLFQAARNFLFARRTAYRATFFNPPGEAVLKDLAKFCRAHASTAHADPIMAARLDGRREVFLRIQTHLRLTDEQLWEMYGERKTPS